MTAENPYGSFYIQLVDTQGRRVDSSNQLELNSAYTLHCLITLNSDTKLGKILRGKQLELRIKSNFTNPKESRIPFAIMQDKIQAQIDHSMRSTLYVQECLERFLIRAQIYYMDSLLATLHISQSNHAFVQSEIIPKLPEIKAQLVIE